MGALVVWEMTIAIHLPTDMISMHASLACLHVCPASSNVKLHANRLILVLPKLDCTAVWNLYAAFALIFASTFAFALLLLSCLRSVLLIWLKPLVGRGRL